MKIKAGIAFAAILYLILLPIASYSELQDNVDSQGNIYRVDKNGNMYTYGNPNIMRQPVSIENLPYYYNETLNLINKKHKFAGIIMGSEILDLPEKSIGIRVSKWSIGKVLAPVISESELNQKVVVVKHIEDSNIIYRNRLYNFELKYPVYFRIFAELAGLEEGTMANVGFILTDPAKEEPPVNIVIFAKKLEGNTSLNNFMESWPKYPSGKYTPLNSPFGGNSIGHKIEWLEGGKVPFAGEQMFVIKDGIGYCIMLSSPKDKYNESQKTFKEFLSNIRIYKMSTLKYISDDDPEVKSFLKEKTSQKKN